MSTKSASPSPSSPTLPVHKCSNKGPLNVIGWTDEDISFLHLIQELNTIYPPNYYHLYFWIQYHLGPHPMKANMLNAVFRMSIHAFVCCRKKSLALISQTASLSISPLGICCRYNERVWRKKKDNSINKAKESHPKKKWTIVWSLAINNISIESFKFLM